MNLEFFIAKRVALSESKSFARLIIRIAMVSVAISVAVMIITTSMISGFKKEISRKIFGFWGHIHITDPDVNRTLLEAYPVSIDQPFYPALDSVGRIDYPITKMAFGQEVGRIARTKGGIHHIQTFAVKPGIIKAKSEIEGIILKGVGMDFDWNFINSYIQEGEALSLQDTAMSSDIMISRQTADRLRVGVGDRFIVHFVEKGEQLKRRFTIKGIYKTGLDEFDRKFALVDIRQIQRLLGWTEKDVAGFEVFLDDIDDLIPMADYIYYDKIPPNSNLYVETIREKFPEIFEWLDLQNVNEKVILILMVIVAIINMITALLILILERTNTIGTLKALGFRNWGIQKIFLYYASYIILVGLFWGNLIGIGLCFLQDQYGFIRLSEADYYLSVAPVDINFFTILALNAGALVIILFALLLPSLLVMSISPVKAIRFK
ncbi:MAG: ABC transporter permease [Lewinellaceae bacterium]|nr:ABC transporter permease [Lewinella sp.]MCB9280402.1 ABC transporter permease [Lewinellaceae bacterium]